MWDVLPNLMLTKLTHSMVYSWFAAEHSSRVGQLNDAIATVSCKLYSVSITVYCCWCVDETLLWLSQRNCISCWCVGEIGEASGTQIAAVTHWNYKTICRGPDSLIGRLIAKDASKRIEDINSLWLFSAYMVSPYIITIVHASTHNVVYVFAWFS